QVTAGSGGRRQCALLQVTDDVVAEAGFIRIPADRSRSKFNDGDVLTYGSGTFDPSDAKADQEGALVVPRGRLRWSRYEIDYTIAERPYLVRRDIIGWHPSDPVDAPSMEYPACKSGSSGNQCPIPQLHLSLNGPGGDGDKAPRTPVAPMIEDMQVSVGCDGYVTAEISPGNISSAFQGKVDLGGREGLTNDGTPNTKIDACARTNERFEDEWLGNAIAEASAPDCVSWGTGETFATSWVATGRPSETAAT